MSALGFKLNRSFRNPALPTLVSWDYLATRDLLLTVPSLMAFRDHSDLSTITKNGSNQVSEIADLSGNGFTATASGVARPVYSSGAFVDANGGAFAGGSTFDGSMKYGVTGQTSGNKKLTVAFTFYTPDVGLTSQMFASDSATEAQNFYLTSAALRMYSATVTLASINTTLVPNWVIYTVNHDTDEANIYSNLGSVSGTTDKGPMDGDVFIGGWTDALTDNNLIGAIGDDIWFDEDLSTNAYALTTLQEYLSRKTRAFAS